MNDREKIISALENCSDPAGKCRDCPYEECERFEKSISEYPDELIRKAVELLKEQEPMVLTLEELVARWQVPPQERDPFWEEWKSDKGKGTWRLYNRSIGGYGFLWRCWSAKPTDEQREAVPWED